MIYWCVLMERSIEEHAVDALLDVATYAGFKRYTRLSIPYMRVDVARNQAVSMFLQSDQYSPLAPNPDDYLVMLDADHAHPHDILMRITQHALPVVGALAFRRDEPFDPLIFRADKDGRLKRIDTPTGGLMHVDAVGTGAIAIRRNVLNTLQEKGYRAPFFRFDYRLDSPIWSFGEDLRFCEMCRNSGIPIYCDTSTITPHITIDMVIGRRWKTQQLATGQIDLVEHVRTKGKFAPVPIKTQVQV